jgi:hypothetical protein
LHLDLRVITQQERITREKEYAEAKERRQAERIAREKKTSLNEERRQAEHRKKLERNYKIPKDFEATAGSHQILKKKERLRTFQYNSIQRRSTSTATTRKQNFLKTDLFFATLISIPELFALFTLGIFLM